MVNSNLLTALFFLSIAASSTRALPSGAPNCVTSRAAPDDFHLLEYAGRTRQTGSLDTFGWDLALNNAMIVDPTKAVHFVVNQTHELSIQSRGTDTYRGVLLLLHHSSGVVDMGSMALLPASSLFEAAMGCVGTPVSGVTHSSSSPKDRRNTIALLKWDSALEDIKLDVNVVVANNGTYSLYFYTQFSLRAVAPGAPGAAAPVTTGPVATPTQVQAPVSVPAPAPCGLFRLGIFCPKSLCGWGGRLLRLCRQ